MKLLLQNKAFFHLWVAQLFSRMGDGILTTVIIFLVGSITQDPLMIGFVLFAQLGPSAVLGVIAGTIADRFPRQLIMIGADLYRTVIVFLMLANYDSVSILIFLVLMEGIGTAFFYPARSAFISEIVEKKKIVEAMGISQSTYFAMSMIGPSIAGFLLLLDNLALVFIMDALTFLLSSFFILLASLYHKSLPPNLHKSEKPFLASVALGIQVIFESEPLRLVILMILPFMVIAGALETNYNALLLKTFQMNGIQYGMSEAIMSGGAIIGSIWVAALLTKKELGHQLLIVTVCIGMLMLFVAPLHYLLPVTGLSLVYIWCLTLGLLNGTLNTIINSLFITITPPQYRGRGVSLLQAVITVGLIGGILFGGWVAQNTNVLVTITGAGILMILFALLFPWIKGYKFSTVTNSEQNNKTLKEVQ
ncbi:MAG: MFS transporter [Brevibacillus sp.]|nr:MFS transporter [Brevibacillus sp.]